MWYAEKINWIGRVVWQCLHLFDLSLLSTCASNVPHAGHTHTLTHHGVMDLCTLQLAIVNVKELVLDP